MKNKETRKSKSAHIRLPETRRPTASPKRADAFAPLLVWVINTKRAMKKPPRNRVLLYESRLLCFEKSSPPVYVSNKAAVDPPLNSWEKRDQLSRRCEIHMKMSTDIVNTKKPLSRCWKEEKRFQNQIKRNNNTRF